MDPYRRSTSYEEAGNYINNFDEDEGQSEQATILNAKTQDQTNERETKEINETNDTDSYIETERTEGQFINDLNCEIRNLKEENTELRLRLKTAGETYTKQDELAKEHAQTIQRLQEEVNKKTEECKKVQEMCCNLKEELEEKIATIRSLTEENTGIKSEKQILQSELYVHKERLTTAGESYTEKALLAENYANTIERLQDDVNKKTEECKMIQDKYKIEIKALQDVIENQKSTIVSLQQNETVSANTIRQLTEELHKKEAEKQQLLKKMMNYRTEMKDNERNMNSLKQQVEIYVKGIQTLQEIIEKQKSEIERLQQNETVSANTMRQLTEDMHKKEAEKQQLLIRLSKLTGAKLTIDNPNIADLSDDKRPTKLAEEFAEMYDNEWTDAFEEVTVEKEREKIAFMLDILKRAYELCKGVSEDHMNRIKLNICKLSLCVKDRTGKSAERLYKERSKDTESNHKTEGEAAIDVVVGENHAMHDLTFEFGSLPDDLKKGVMDSRKLVEKGLSEQLEKIATVVIASEKGINVSAHTSLSKYIGKCINICWSMCCIVPPVVVSFQEVVSGMHFDTYIYKPYTKTGKKIDYIVWPALFLHQDGPMLCKGVAQGRS